MYFFRFLAMLLITLLFNNQLYAQYKIYTSSSVISCEIYDITQSFVTYSTAQSSKEQNIDISKVFLIFSEKGTYLIPSKMDFKLFKTTSEVTKFILNKNESPASDMIFKTNGTIFSEAITKDDKNFVYLANGNKVDKESISAIIYKNGRHEILGSAAKAADVLWAAIENTFQSNQINTNTLKNKDTEPVITKTTVSENKVSDSTTKSQTEPQISSSNQNPELNDSLPVYDKEQFKKKANEKIIQFTTYVKLILDKKSDAEKVNKAITQCISLFINENAIIQVSSLNSAPKSRKIREYLSHIKLIQYDNVEVKWTNVSYVTDIYKGQDGNYYGTITFEQEFKGSKDGIITYSDVTLKKATVSLKTYEKIVDGKMESIWDVFLGDIGVESTRSL